VQALIRAHGAKLEALRALEAALPVGQNAKLEELAERNRANGVLLARRRREVNWALRQLGRSEESSAYDAKGQSNTCTRGARWPLPEAGRAHTAPDLSNTDIVGALFGCPM
jgi:hypothetical protein